MSTPKDDRALLQLLKFELRFLEDGGYGRSPHAPRRQSLAFEDSPTCMNFNTQANREPCTSCMLMQFVPPSRVLEQIPCRHILLNAEGQTLCSLYESGDQQKMEEALGTWLRATIKGLEQPQNAGPQTVSPSARQTDVKRTSSSCCCDK
ncbi:MAG TPA: hypothetical protein VJQ82_16655 [Terriglobales bacterium]|nr:hypothetical protein [Terriglobales bacterium]